MAAFALQPFMRALEPELSSCVVIERPQGPVYGRMTVGTFRAESRFVRVILEVAVDALLLGVMERWRCMTVRAFDLTVAAEQREDREVMVESHILRPFDFRVA